MTDIFSYSLSCVQQKQHNVITFTWYQERKNNLYNKKIKKNWRTYKGHWWILKSSRCSLSVHQGTLETHILERGTLWTLLGMMKFRGLTHPDLKTPCKSLRRLCLSFCLDLQEETDEVMTQELQGLPRLSNIEWLCDLIFLADVFQFSQQWHLQSPRKFASPLLDYVNSSEGTLKWLQKSRSGMNKKIC